MAKKKMGCAQKPRKVYGVEPSASFAKNLAELRDLAGREHILKLWSAADGKLWPPLAAAFKYFDLDPKSPADHEWLLFLLAIAAFESPPRRGNPGKSNWEIIDDDYALGLDYLKVTYGDPDRKADDPVMSDRQAAEAIKKIPGQKATADTIRQRLPDARKAVDWIRQYIELKRNRPHR